MFVCGPGKKIVRQMIVARIVIHQQKTLKRFLRALARSKISQHLLRETLLVYRRGAFRITLSVDAQAENTLTLTFKKGVLKPWSKNLQKTMTVTYKPVVTKKPSRP